MTLLSMCFMYNSFYRVYFQLKDYDKRSRIIFKPKFINGEYLVVRKRKLFNRKYYQLTMHISMAKHIDLKIFEIFYLALE